MSPALPLRRPRGSAVLALAAVSALLLATAGRAAAEEKPWERAIRDGVAQQDRELARTSAKALVRQLESRVSRDSDVVATYLLGRAYGKAGDYASAIDAYGEAIKQEPGCYFAWRDRGIARQLAKDSPGAETDLKQAISIKPDFVVALLDLATLYVDSQRAEAAVPLLERALDVQPANEPARVKLVQVYRDLVPPRPAEAMRTLQPLRARSPSNPFFRLLEAELVSLEGHTAEALAEFKRLATENPDWPAPLADWVKTAQAAKSVDVEEAIGILERFLRIARDDKRRQEIRAQIDRLREASKPAAQGAEPPTGPALAALLDSPDAKVRTETLRWLLRPGSHPPTVSGDALKSLLRRLTDPDPLNRGLALLVFQRSGTPEVAPLVRLSLRDEDPGVRGRAADALASLGNPAGVAALQVHAVGSDALLATAARAAIYRLAKVAPPPSEETPEASLAAFKAWWASEEARAVKVDSIRAVLASADVRPWEVLFPYVLDPDAAVWTTAYHALARVASAAKGDSPREAWFRKMPSFDAPALVPQSRDRVVEAMSAWWLSKPEP